MVETTGKFEIFPKRYGFFPYVFLIYLAMPIFFMAQETGVRFIIGVVMILLFLLTYRQLYFSFERRSFVYWLILQIGIILFLATFYNINLVFLGFFPANFIGWFKNKKSFYTALSFFTIAIIIPVFVHLDFLLDNGLHFVIIFILIMLLSPFGIRSMNSRMELEQQLDAANQRIEELVKREERMRIARDLHDTLGHTLSLLTLKAQLVSKLTTKDAERAKLEAEEMERTSRSALSQVRELVSDMRSVTIAEVLVEAEEILQAAGITLEINGETNMANIPSVSQNILSLCLRESITNVVRHSKATHCVIHLEQNEGDVTITVQDDGIGMTKRATSGNGLKGMKERLDLIDGKMKVLGEKGTKLVLSIPIIVQERKEGALS
ncbi:sensor histidine kinase [Evansella tamaricis]|uniref:histidine kinase n=1 Tax=Evansella tamaricis TaxID=2069301 RepID=A0ABS6JFU0_9BACI|nr:sensor histidine kinase [Evansella tamaricis]MBU9711697.1 sensor histidine kinase [Evansella tamaricis]